MINLMEKQANRIEEIAKKDKKKKDKVKGGKIKKFKLGKMWSHIWHTQMIN